MESKEQAGYEVPAADPNTTCGICMHYSNGTCNVVWGPGLIEPYAWCKYYLGMPAWPG